MHTLYLPILPLRTTPADALKAMKQHRRSGVLVEGPRGFFAVRGGALLRARERGDQTLGKVSGRRPAVILKPRDLQRKGLVVRRGALVRARKQRHQTPAKVSGRGEVATLKPRDVQRGELGLRVMQRDMPALAKAFSRQQTRDFTMLATAPHAGSGRSIGLVITRSEARAAEYASPADYFCTGPRQHSLPPYKRGPDGNCGACGYPITQV
jgi:hypothetical protein